MKNFIQLFHKLARRTRRKYPIVSFARIDSAQKNIEHAAEILLVLVTWQTPLQVAMQRHRINAKLQIIKIPGHFGRNILRRVTASVRSQPIRFPIDKIEASLVLKNQIDESFHESISRRELQAIDRKWQLLHLKDLAPTCRGSCGNWKSELQFRESRRARHLGKRTAIFRNRNPQRFR